MDSEMQIERRAPGEVDTNALNVKRTEGLFSWMADQYGMSRAVLSDTLRKTIFPNERATPEQLAAFCAVAYFYGLNPFLKEIYAFPAKGGGVVPIVSVDGWTKLVNRHPSLDGLQFSENRDANGKLVSVSCTIWRKDRAHETTVTEYLAECKRNSEPWNSMPSRMLRHRALIQCARVVFGFGGIYSEDEGAAMLRGEKETPQAVAALNAGVAAHALEAGAPDADAAVQRGESESQETSAPPKATAAEPGLPLDFS